MNKKLFELLGYKTLAAARRDERYIKTFMIKGNAKLKDYIYSENNERLPVENALVINDKRNYKYAQFNLPALSTCPFSTEGCRKFCYAKRDERWTVVRENRSNNFEISKMPDFVDRMIYTITVNLCSNRYNGSVMIIRIHESGEFYNQEYFNNWLKVINHFMDCKDIIFQFYTKAFDYILNLNEFYSNILKTGLENHVIGCSLSSDPTTKPTELLKILRIKNMYPNVNEYKAVPASMVENENADHICDCADCAKCGHCTVTTNELNIVAIH